MGHKHGLYYSWHSKDHEYKHANIHLSCVQVPQVCSLGPDGRLRTQWIAPQERGTELREPTSPLQ